MAESHEEGEDAFRLARYDLGYPYPGYSKHEFACIPMAAVYIDTSSV